MMNVLKTQLFSLFVLLAPEKVFGRLHEPTTQTCSVDEVLGHTFLLPYTFNSGDNVCFKVQFFLGGIFAVDLNNPNCDNDSFNDSFIYSRYEKYTGDKAFFEGMGVGHWYGHFSIKEDPSVTKLTVDISEFKGVLRTFDVNLLFPACPKAPSTVPSSMPTHMPTIGTTCSSEGFLGDTFYAPYTTGLGTSCYKVELFEGGVIAADVNDPTCSHTSVSVESYVLSHYESSDANKANFVKSGFALYSANVLFKHDPTTTGAELQIKSVSEDAKDITFDLISSSCDPSPFKRPGGVVVSACPSAGFLGDTFYTPHSTGLGTSCYKIELFEGGVIAVDLTDPTCSNTAFVESYVLSHYGSADANTTTFVPTRDALYSATTSFKYDSTATSTELKIKSLDESAKEITFELVASSCDPNPSRWPVGPTCPSAGFLGDTFYVPYGTYCYKVELFEGGVISADVTDPTCSNTAFVESHVVSHFSSTDSHTTTFVKSGNAGYAGTVSFKYDATVTGTDFQMKSISERAKTFTFDLISSSCDPTPSKRPTISTPSSMPTHMPTISSACPPEKFLGDTFYTPHSTSLGTSCYKIELFENGVIAVDITDPTCSNTNFVESYVLSHYRSADANMVYFAKSGDALYSATALFKYDATATDTELQITSLSESAKEITFQLVVVSC